MEELKIITDRQQLKKSHQAGAENPIQRKKYLKKKKRNI